MCKYKKEYEDQTVKRFTDASIECYTEDIIENGDDWILVKVKDSDVKKANKIIIDNLFR